MSHWVVNFTSMKYNKLIRDLIPKVIEADGKEAVMRILSDDEFINALNKKLQEEVDEYQDEESIEELADVLEVVYAIAQSKGVSEAELNKIRQEKRTRRGGFDKKLFLIETKEP